MVRMSAGSCPQGIGSPRGGEAPEAPPAPQPERTLNLKGRDPMGQELFTRLIPDPPSVFRARRRAVSLPRPGTAPWCVTAAFLAFDGGTTIARWRGRVCPRTPGSVARTERGDIDGFPPSPRPLLRGLPRWLSRPGQRELAYGFPAPGAPALRLRGLRLHIPQGDHRGATIRPAAPPALRAPATSASRAPARRMIDDALGKMSTVDDRWAVR